MKRTAKLIKPTNVIGRVKEVDTPTSDFIILCENGDYLITETNNLLIQE